MYQTLYDMCLNTERVMRMFSKELQELDRNTVKYMIEEQQKEIERISAENAQKDALIAELMKKLEDQKQ